MQVAESGQPDLDYQLLGPDGEVVQQSGNGVGPEYVSVNVTIPGTYTHRVIGFSGVGTEFTVNTKLTKGNAPPSLNVITGEFTDAQSRQVDFDGTFTLAWQGSGGERSYEVERSTDNGGTWKLIATPGASASSLALSNQPNGTINFRVRGRSSWPGRILRNARRQRLRASLLIVAARLISLVRSQLRCPTSRSWAAYSSWI